MQEGTNSSSNTIQKINSALKGTVCAWYRAMKSIHLLYIMMESKSFFFFGGRGGAAQGLIPESFALMTAIDSKN